MTIGQNFGSSITKSNKFQLSIAKPINYLYKFITFKFYSSSYFLQPSFSLSVRHSSSISISMSSSSSSSYPWLSYLCVPSSSVLDLAPDPPLDCPDCEDLASSSCCILLCFVLLFWNHTFTCNKEKTTISK